MYTHALKSVYLAYHLFLSSLSLPFLLANQLGRFFPMGIMTVSGSNPMSLGMSPDRSAASCCLCIARRSEGPEFFFADLAARMTFPARHGGDVENGWLRGGCRSGWVSSRRVTKGLRGRRLSVVWREHGRVFLSALFSGLDIECTVSIQKIKSRKPIWEMFRRGLEFDTSTSGKLSQHLSQLRQRRRPCAFETC